MTILWTSLSLSLFSSWILLLSLFFRSLIEMHDQGRERRQGLGKRCFCIKQHEGHKYLYPVAFLSSIMIIGKKRDDASEKRKCKSAERERPKHLSPKEEGDRKVQHRSSISSEEKIQHHKQYQEHKKKKEHRVHPETFLLHLHPQHFASSSSFLCFICLLFLFPLFLLLWSLHEINNEAQYFSYRQRQIRNEKIQERKSRKQREK